MGVFEQIRAEARQEARLDTLVEITKELLSKGFPVDSIAEISKLPKEKVLELKSQMNLA